MSTITRTPEPPYQADWTNDTWKLELRLNAASHLSQIDLVLHFLEQLVFAPQAPFAHFAAIVTNQSTGRDAVTLLLNEVRASSDQDLDVESLLAVCHTASRASNKTMVYLANISRRVSPREEFYRQLEVLGHGLTARALTCRPYNLPRAEEVAMA